MNENNNDMVPGMPSQDQPSFNQQPTQSYSNQPSGDNGKDTIGSQGDAYSQGATSSYDAAYQYGAPDGSPAGTYQTASMQNAQGQPSQSTQGHAGQFSQTGYGQNAQSYGQSTPTVHAAQSYSSEGPYNPPTGSPVRTTIPYTQASHAAAKPKGNSSGKTFLIAFAGALVACVLAIGVSLGFGLIGNSSKSTVNIGAATTSSIEAAGEEATLAEAVANKCLPSVVSIDVYGTASSSGNSIYDYLYGYNQNNDGGTTQVSLGSGVILSEDGYIITNNHVVSNGTEFKVTIEGEKYDAELIGTDASSDVAVLKVKDGSGFTPITLGDSDNITIGEWVMSIGSPFGLEQSVATGIVSATSRSQIMDSQSNIQNGQSGDVTIYPNMIQTDAAINPGNSGGALVNANGELIGVNTLITSYSGNYSGVGFAIPSNYAINLAQSIISGEEPTHAQLGITMTTINSSISKRYGFDTDEGAYVSGVIDGTPAAQAGIKVGDIITAFDGKQVSSSSDVMLDVRTKNPGDKVTITVNRDGQTQDIEVTLGTSQQSSSSDNKQQNNQNQNGPNGSNGSNGSNGMNPFFNLFN